MATCQCGEVLPGRRQKCDACKVRPGKNSSGPEGAPDVAGSSVEPATSGPEELLHARGRALWKTLGQSIDTVPGQIALEACRVADRLDELERIIAGKGVLNLMRFRVGSDWADDLIRAVDITVTFDGVLTEARQQQATFAKLLSEVGAPAAAPSKPKASTPLDELQKKRMAKS